MVECEQTKAEIMQSLRVKRFTDYERETLIYFPLDSRKENLGRGLVNRTSSFLKLFLITAIMQK